MKLRKQVLHISPTYQMCLDAYARKLHELRHKGIPILKHTKMPLMVIFGEEEHVFVTETSINNGYLLGRTFNEIYPMCPMFECHIVEYTPNNDQE